MKPLIPTRRRRARRPPHARSLSDQSRGSGRELAANRVGSDLFQAFAEAKNIYLDRLAKGQIEEPSATDKLFTRVMEVTGDPLPYGIEPNRRALEAVIQHSVEQGIISRPFTVEELFAENTRRLKA